VFTVLNMKSDQLADGRGYSSLWSCLRLRHCCAVCTGSLAWPILKCLYNNFELQEVSGITCFLIDGPEG
jgi:hypothetical protein